jgi:hypothetical protein
MKRHLDENKKRVAEKTSAAEVPQKSLGKAKAENAGLLKDFDGDAEALLGKSGLILPATTT